jgi:type IV secretion system protein VirD4
VSEPEVARPLITPDEVMRLGSHEALIFTSGRPAIRALKLRYYADLVFKDLAEIAAPAKSDRFEYSEGNDQPRASSPANKNKSAKPAQALTLKSESSVRVAASNGNHPQTQRASEQLSFLKPALESHESATVAEGKEPAAKERLL